MQMRFEKSISCVIRIAASTVTVLMTGQRIILHPDIAFSMSALIRKHQRLSNAEKPYSERFSRTIPLFLYGYFPPQHVLCHTISL